MFDADDLLENDPRRRFEQILLARCRAGKPFALMLVNLEGFADVSARFGTDIAALLLYEIASRLREKLNENDLVTRRGPSEFAVFVHGIDNMESANRLAEELIDRLESPATVSGARFRLTRASVSRYRRGKAESGDCCSKMPTRPSTTQRRKVGAASALLSPLPAQRTNSVRHGASSGEPSCPCPCRCPWHIIGAR